MRHLPILCNYYTNLWEVQKSAEESLKENLGDNDASGNASGWVSDIAPSAASGLELRIPLALVFRNTKPHFPQKLRVNFYKCADKTKQPHYLSWQPIPLPQPNFHCPQFFGEIELQ